MTVDVEGEAYVGVSQEILHKLGVYSLPQQKRGARVPEIVEARLLGAVRMLKKGLEGAGSRSPYGGGEDEAPALARGRPAISSPLTAACGVP